MSKIGNLNEYRILVTGACGFLGRQLVQTLIKNGAFVVAIDRDPIPKYFAESLENESFQFISGDFLKKSNEVLSQLMSERRKKTAVVHMAGIADVTECEKNPDKAFESNVFLTFQVLEFCRRYKIRKFIFPSTGLVYGNHLEKRAVEGDPTSSSNIYAASKLSAETLIQGYAKSFGLCCIIVRLSNVYGPEMSADTVVGTILKLIKNSDKIIVRDLSPVRDFIYIDDVVEGLIRLLVSVDDCGCYIINLSTGVGSTIQELAETACRAASIPINRIQSYESHNLSKSQLVLDNALLVRQTGWKPKYTLFEGLSSILKGYN